MEPLIEADVLPAVSFEIRARAIGIHVCAKCGQHGASNTPAPKAWIHCYRTKVPVRLELVMLRPLACPFQDAKSCASRITQYESGNYAELFQHSGLAEAGPGDAADTHQSLIAEGSINQSSAIKTAQHWPEKSRERFLASRRARDSKCAKTYGVVGHPAAEKLCRGIEVGWLQFAQCHLR